MNTIVDTANNRLETALAEHPFLRGMKPEHLRVLADNAMRVRHEKGELIFGEGDPANRFYLIESGKVSVEAARRDGAGTPVQMLGAGEVLGWSWLFPPYYWHFDARAVEPTTSLFLYGTRLSEACEKDHDLGYELMKRTAQVVIQRLQAARQQLLQTGR
jgi:CRP/FNR family cyclic AMP-dependent transcriptional regulator